MVHSYVSRSLLRQLFALRSLYVFLIYHYLLHGARNEL